MLMFRQKERDRSSKDDDTMFELKEEKKKKNLPNC